jgi:putative transferase (TIGR04331 family)
MHSKVPTIMLFKMEYYEFHPEFKKLVKVLVGAGILFDNPNDASSHINKIWKDPELWWNQPKTINARKMFFEYCGCVDKDWSNSWVSFFKEVRGLKVTE